MNRYATFAVLALAALALAVSSAPAHNEAFSDEAETQSMLSTTDDEETAEVHARDLGVFADFCIQSRDFVFADVKARAGSVSSQGFSSFFAMTEDIAREALNVQQDATGRLAGQLAHPGNEVDGEGTIADAQREISGQQQPLALLTAVRGTLSATATAVVNVFSQKVESMKSFTNLDQVVHFAQNGCEIVNSYEEQLRSQFEEYKQSSLTGDLQKQYASTPMDKVPCVTATRIVRGNGVCGFVKVAFQPVKKMLGYGHGAVAPTVE